MKWILSTTVCRSGSLALLLSVALCPNMLSAAPLQVGEQAPIWNYSIGTPSGGNVDRQALRGKVVLLDIWATWCEPCRKSLPVYMALQTELGPAGFAVVAISVDARADELQEFVTKAKLNFSAIGWDPKGLWPTRIGLKTMPTAVLIDRQGRVSKIFEGFTDEEHKRLETAVRALVGKASSPTAATEKARQDQEVPAVPKVEPANP